jgi:hypothetical protein
MDSLISAIEGVVAAEPEPEVQPDPTQPGDVAIETSNTSQMRSSVVMVMGRPASICCQCLAENPK